MRRSTNVREKSERAALANDDTQATGPGERGRHATRSIIWSSWSQLIVAVCGLAWLFTVPRVLGADRYGVYILLSSLVDFHTMACTLGIHNAFAYYYPRYHLPGRERELARLTNGYSALVIALSVIGVVVVIAAGQALGGPRVTSSLIGCVGLAALLQAGSGILGGILYGGNRIAVYCVRFPIQRLLTVMLVLWGSMRFGLNGAIVALTATALLTFIWLLSVVKPWRKAGSQLPALTAPKDTPPVGGLRSPVTFGVLAMFGSLASLTITRGGNIVLASVGRSSVEVAVFAVGLAFVLQGTMLLSALGTALTPGLSGMLAAGEHERAQDWARRAAKYQVFAALAAVAFVMFLGDDLLRTAVGNRFPEVFFVTEMGVLALIPLSQMNLINQAAVAWGHPRVNLESWLLMSSTFVLSASYAGALRGPLGAATALVIMSWFAALVAGHRLHSLGGPNLWPAPVTKILLIGLSGLVLAGLHGGVLQNLGLYFAFLLYITIGSVLLRVIGLDEVRDIVASFKSSQSGHCRT